MKNEAANAPITFQEIVTVMIKPVTTYKAKESIQSYYHEDCAIIAWDVERLSKIVHLPALYFFWDFNSLGLIQYQKIVRITSKERVGDDLFIHESSV